MGQGYTGELLKVSIAFTEEETAFLEAICRGLSQGLYKDFDVKFKEIANRCQALFKRRLDQLKENRKLTERLPKIEK